ncbi:hypothetical protein WICMUC_004511 [Wickerhamomyces mucosus]|uniref:Uncharacterized protein n=1 Tax=Wickerhamomyces mucosus TaxID=1378264 RepID=A0A9P8TAV2_9ASCO|nr:hypothetical protein WICMUC_004511 [Wickerhamomyces mucosus]
MRHSNHLIASLSIVISSLISITTGVLGILIICHNSLNNNIKIPLVVLVAGLLLEIIALPLSFVNIYIISLITSASSFITLGAGLSFIHFALFKSLDIHLLQVTLFEPFFLLLFSTVLLKGFTISTTSFHHSTLFTEDFNNLEDEGQIPRGKLKTLEDRYISMKPSSATLVDHSRMEDRFGRSRSLLSAKPSISSFAAFENFDTKKSPIIDYSIKKLSVINQSTSSANISQSSKVTADNNGTDLSECPSTTPTLPRFIDSSQDKNVILERDALNRIPTALLPPHLKSQEKPIRRSNSLFEKPTLSRLNFQTNFSPIAMTRDALIQEIPRAHTFQDIQPFSNDHGKINTITLENWEAHQESYKKQTNLMAPFQPTLPFKGSDFLKKEDLSLEIENEDQISINSTNEALKFLEGAKHSNDDHIFQTAMTDKTQSTIHLDTLDHNTNKPKSHSPHKSSIFRSHSQKSSITSIIPLKLSASVPTSPKKKSPHKSSPSKMLQIKNLSLSNIVFDEKYDEAIPDLSYVHELQRSPKKRSKSLSKKELKTPNKDTPLDYLTPTNFTTTPESIHSQRSIFPSDVIGEYDREKWKTMERLNLIKDGISIG